MSWKSILLIIVSAVVVLILVVVGLAASAPKEFVVQESVAIQAGPDKIFAYLNRLENWEHWSPWKAKDPSIKTTYEGPAEGVGAKQTWTSDKSGSGSLTITESLPSEVIRYSLVFSDFKTTNAGEIRLSEEQGKTIVTWVMSGSRSFQERFFWVLFNLESTIHDDFKFGLERLQKLIENNS